MENPDLTVWLGIGSFGVGFAIAVVNLVAYSDFLARLQLVAPELVEELEMEIGDRWSRKNIEISKYLWYRRYEALGNSELDRIGGRIRRLGFLAAGFVILGILLLAAEPWIKSLNSP